MDNILMELATYLHKVQDQDQNMKKILCLKLTRNLNHLFRTIKLQIEEFQCQKNSIKKKVHLEMLIMRLNLKDLVFTEEVSQLKWLIIAIIQDRLEINKN